MAELKFEEALKKLETIVEGLENGKISLEDSLKKYEEGIKLARFCSQKIDEAEKKIEILTKEPSGKLKKESFKPEDKPSHKKTKEEKEDEDFLF